MIFVRNQRYRQEFQDFLRNQCHRQEFQAYKFKINLPMFDGHLQFEEDLDWLHSVENFFDYMDITPTKKLN